MTSLADELRGRADRIAGAYAVRARPRAILLVGSTARGVADEYSDLDMILYYDTLPGEESLAAARTELGAEGFTGRSEADGYGERYYLDGVECQLAHVTVAVAESEIEKVVDRLELDDVLLKIMSGIFEGRALFGESLIEAWRRKAAYTGRLQRALIQKHWTFFPWWFFDERLRRRDTTIWRYDVLVQSAYNLVGVLAALNSVYFSKFEFKRAGDFLARLEVAPRDFGRRLHDLFELDEREATDELERLVAETGALVAERFPDLDLSLRWGVHETPPGSRETPWRPATPA